MYMTKRYRLPISTTYRHLPEHKHNLDKQKSNFTFCFIYLISASPHPASSSLSKERRGGTTAEEDDYNYDDEDEPSKELGTNDVNGADLNTMLLTKNHTVETEINDTVTLPCRVTNPQSEFLFPSHSLRYNSSSRCYLSVMYWNRNN